MMNENISEEYQGKGIYESIVKEIHSISSLENDRAIGLLFSPEAYYLSKRYLDSTNSSFLNTESGEYFMGCKILVLNALSGTKVMVLTEDLIKRNLIGEL